MERRVWTGCERSSVADTSAIDLVAMSDYTIVGWQSARRILEHVQPFVVFKREQVDRALSLLDALERTRTPNEFLDSAKLVDAFATLNYSKRKVIDAACVATFLGGKGLLVPVTTEALCEPRSSATAIANSEANLSRRSHASSSKEDEDIVCAPRNRGFVHA